MKVFICYSKQDEAFAQRLLKDLHTKGISALTYADVLKPGMSWAEQIALALKAATNIFFIISRHSVNNEFVSTEIALAVSQSDKAQNKRIIPLLIDQVIDVPFFLQRYLYIDMSTELKYQYGLDMLIMVINEKPVFVEPKIFDEASKAVLMAQRSVLIANQIDYKKSFMSKQLSFAMKLLTSIFISLIVAVFIITNFIITNLNIGTIIIDKKLILGIFCGIIGSLLASYLPKKFEAIFRAKSKDIEARNAKQ